MDSHIYSIDEIKNSVQDIAREYGVKKIYLFGSYARHTANLGSDIDLVIENGDINDYFTLTEFQLDLYEIFKINVDVLTLRSLSKEFYDKISKEVVVLYEQ